MDILTGLALFGSGAVMGGILIADFYGSLKRVQEQERKRAEARMEAANRQMDAMGIKHCIYECLDGKWSRQDVHELLTQFCDWDIEDIARCAKSIKDRPQLFPVVDQIAVHIQQCLKAHRVELPRARNRLIQDGITKKKRKITITCMLQQIYDYIAKIGLQELFDAKFAPHQFAAIKGRG